MLLALTPTHLPDSPMLIGHDLIDGAPLTSTPAPRMPALTSAFPNQDLALPQWKWGKALLWTTVK